MTVQRGDRACRFIEWRPWAQPNNSLLGHCTIAFTRRWIVNAVSVFQHADGSLSVGVPNAAQLDAEGRIKLKAGKRQYAPVLSFETAEARDRWQRMVLAALAAGLKPQRHRNAKARKSSCGSDRTEARHERRR